MQLDFTTEDPPNKQLEIIRDHQHIKDPSEERMPPKKTKIDAEAINTPFPEKVNLIKMKFIFDLPIFKELI